MTMYFKHHAEDGIADVKNPRCDYAGRCKRSSFGVEGSEAVPQQERCGRGGVR